MVSVAFDELNCGFRSRICVPSGVGAGLTDREVTPHGNSGPSAWSLGPDLSPGHCFWRAAPFMVNSVAMPWDRVRDCLGDGQAQGRVTVGTLGRQSRKPLRLVRGAARGFAGADVRTRGHCAARRGGWEAGGRAARRRRGSPPLRPGRALAGPRAPSQPSRLPPPCSFAPAPGPGGLSPEAALPTPVPPRGSAALSFRHRSLCL